MFFTFLLSSMLHAEESCTLDSVTFPSLNTEQSTVLKNYGASCVDTVNNEKAAAELFRAAQNALKIDDIATAKEQINTLMKRYPDTRIARRAQRTQKELNIIGTTVSQDLDTVAWLQGKASFSDAKLSLVVFWELWCPHCKREIPNLQKMYDEFQGRDFNIIGLTKLSRNKSTEEVMNFLQTNSVAYPIGKEDGSLSTLFAVSGIPAGALVKDGKVVWRGHPAQLSTAMIEKHLK